MKSPLLSPLKNWDVRWDSTERAPSLASTKNLPSVKCQCQFSPQKGWFEVSIPKKTVQVSIAPDKWYSDMWSYVFLRDPFYKMRWGNKSYKILAARSWSEAKVQRFILYFNNVILQIILLFFSKQDCWKLMYVASLSHPVFLWSRCTNWSL